MIFSFTSIMARASRSARTFGARKIKKGEALRRFFPNAR
jgi:hypothetical protein